MSVLLETSLGDIVVDLDTEDMPGMCMNFLKLCRLKFYNDCHIFRVERGFIAQAGDPENTGQGGTSVYGVCYGDQAAYFPRDSTSLSRRPRSHSRRGTLSMAATSSSGTKSGTESASKFGSQFFLTFGEELAYLDGRHCPFGVVAEGMDVLTRIENTFVDSSFRPYRLVRIRHTIVLHDPFPDPSGFPGPPPASPLPAQGGDGDRLGSDEELEGPNDGGSEATARREAERERREAQSRAEVLEMLGDLPDADLRPPDSVLFVCKLNPVTEADDLEIIFSRFGECKAAVMRDPATGASLCYGFVEYRGKDQAERAFFKLDNCLIDDRRVRVDFSQSVSKLWNAQRRGERPLRFDAVSVCKRSKFRGTPSRVEQKQAKRGRF